MTPELDEANKAELAGMVLDWWAGVARALPWRETRDPWAVLVSEVMAQQTQVARVIPKWHAFLCEFPTVRDAAAAPASRVIEFWDGLGYNRRALLLHRCAQVIVDEHDGVFPEALDQLLELPGIGPYTARALLAFAFEHDVGVLDTNVGRVLARLSGRPLRPGEAQDLADSLVPEAAGWSWNQAVLDFGAQVCTKRSPSCLRCPISMRCAWAGVGVDPAIGSAGVSTKQSRFHGSDRQYRGRLIAILRRGPVFRIDAASTMGLLADPDRVDSIIDGLVADGMVVEAGAELRLPR